MTPNLAKAVIAVMKAVKGIEKSMQEYLTKKGKK